MSLDNTIKNQVHDFTTLLDEKLCNDIVALDMTTVSSLYDVFIIASVDSIRQANAMVGYIEEMSEKKGYALQHINGLNQSEWILMDYGSIIIHLFTPKARNLYNLERLWGDCERIAWQ